MPNPKAFKLLEERFSMMVKTFNHANVSDTDSDDHYWTVRDRLDLGRVALERAPEFQVSTLARSLGDIYRAVRKNLTPDELKRWEESNEALEELHDKYGL
ncbi:hypothetical protein [Streptomyces sp. 1222.5]|uniref:hypothetical protein n=1 Tax=Streptomyces sp. 1222.5 TaxID=1881026 RepID=UPI003EBB78F1